jgi:hypothetical protein
MITPARLAIAAVAVAFIALIAFRHSGNSSFATAVTSSNPSSAASRETPPAATEPTWRESSTVPVSNTETDSAPAAELRRRLEEASTRLPDIAAQREASRLALHWLKLDRDALLAWLNRPRDNNHLDPVRASVSQVLAAGGEFEQAQRLAESITEPAIYEWAHQNALAQAYERKIITADQVRNSGLSPAAIDNILNGSFRD